MNMNMNLNMKKNGYFPREPALSHYPVDNPIHYGGNVSEIFFDPNFFEQLRLEKLRVQRSKSSLSIILLTPDKKTGGESINMSQILGVVRAKTRDTDICGFVNHNTIGILLPDTDEKGAKEICVKLVNGNINPRFSTTTSTYPDHIFESLAKDGYVRPDAYPFELEGLLRAPWFKLLLKRGVDILGSIIGIVVFMPVMIITALAIKATSPGPVIFSQTRLGKQGTPFTFYKFRSMHVDIGDQIHRDYILDFIKGHNKKANQGDAEEPLYKMKSDPRITRVGRFIRKTSIDELPQFFNVLKGDMSLVGPRPPLPYEAEKYESWHLMRILEMKPGITGLWQVEGRSKTGWDDTVRLDIRYIQNWSLIFDLKILFKTVKVVLWDRGAV
jgi:lipopolysaccharide/colanic/teichoic acid biosynthesis glycosyltransferase